MQIQKEEIESSLKAEVESGKSYKIYNYKITKIYFAISMTQPNDWNTTEFAEKTELSKH